MEQEWLDSIGVASSRISAARHGRRGGPGHVANPSEDSWAAPPAVPDLGFAGAQAGEVIAGRAREETTAGKKADVDAFAYTEPAGRLEFFTEPLIAVVPPGFVREALLTTSVDPNGTLLNRLRMQLNHGEVRSLDLVLPRGLTVVRVRRDEAEVTPIRSAAGLSIPLTESGAGSRSSTIVVDYLAARGALRDGDRLWPDVPRVASLLACRSCGRSSRLPAGEQPMAARDWSPTFGGTP